MANVVGRGSATRMFVPEMRAPQQQPRDLSSHLRSGNPAGSGSASGVEQPVSVNYTISVMHGVDTSFRKAS